MKRKSAKNHASAPCLSAPFRPVITHNHAAINGYLSTFQVLKSDRKYLFRPAAEAFLEFKEAFIEVQRGFS